jgi:hypothetical protein
MQSVKEELLKPWKTSEPFTVRFNADGFCGQAGMNGYVQLFRTGHIESVRIIEGWTNVPDSVRAIRGLKSRPIEESVLAMSEPLQAIQQLGINLPIMMSVAVNDVQDGMIAESWQTATTHHTIEQNSITFPEVLFEAWPSKKDFTEKARTLIDMIWNASGYPQSPYFDVEGEYHFHKT